MKGGGERGGKEEERKGRSVRKRQIDREVPYRRK